MPMFMPMFMPVVMPVVVVMTLLVVMIFMLGVGRVAHVLVPPSDTATCGDGSAQHCIICV